MDIGAIHTPSMNLIAPLLDAYAFLRKSIRDDDAQIIITESHLSDYHQILSVLDEWRTHKVKLLIWGGAAYSLLGGEEPIRDLDHILLVQQEFEKLPKRRELGNMQPVRVADYPFSFSWKERIMCDGTPLIPRIHTPQFDLIDFCKDDIDGIALTYETEDLRVYLPTPEFLIASWDGYHATMLEKNALYSRYPDWWKQKRRADELASTFNVQRNY